MAPAVAQTLRTQIRLDVLRPNRVQPNPSTCDVFKKMAAITRVLLDGPPAEIALAHVLAQGGQPLINPRLFGNVCLRGEAINRMLRGAEGLGIMRRKIEREKRLASILAGELRINRCCA